MKLHTGLALSAVCFSAMTVATANDFEDSARVISVAPQVEQINQPRQECRTEYVTTQRPQQRGIGGSVVGGVAGGILGNQVGNGNGRTAATAAGAIVGAIVGDRLENNNSAPAVTEQQPVQRCYMVDSWQTRNTGYSVTYEYHGHTYTALMPYDPGQRMRVRVSVTPQP